jgi:Fic family protein
MAKQVAAPSTKERCMGRWIAQNSGSLGAYRAFVPASLPPSPPLAFSDDLREAETRAILALGRLDGAIRYLPDHELFLYMYVRKEAVLSSQIEGTESSLSDLLLFEQDGAPGVPVADVEEVSAYARALFHGVRRLDVLPLSTRLLREVHRELVSGVRGGDKAPGELRTTQNWIGGSRPGNAKFVPPPAREVRRLLGDLEKFLNDMPARTPTLLKAGLAHVQFETIHPFLDGNGRVGRLLITLILNAERMLRAPMLYLSLYFKDHRAEYYERLQRVRTHGEWEEWMRFFYQGVADVAEQASETTDAVMQLFERHQRTVVMRGGRAAVTALRVFEHAKKKAVVAIPDLARELGISHPTASVAVKFLEQSGILVEATGKHRDRRYIYEEYVRILSDGPTRAPIAEGSGRSRRGKKKA